MDKRIVFERPDGLMQIMGHSSDLPDGRLPVTAENFVSLGEVVPFASLVRVTTRAAFYRAPIVPVVSESFHANQR